MSNILRTRTLATRFLDGETTIAEEQELCQLLQSDDLPADLLPLRQMVSDLSLIALPPEASEAKPVSKSRRWKVAAAVAVLCVVGASIWLAIGHQDSECVAYVYGQRVTDRQVVMQEMESTIDIVKEQPADNVDELLQDMFDM